MSEDIHLPDGRLEHPDGYLEHPEIRVEPTDANHRWVIGLLIAAIPLAILIQLAVYGFFHGYGAYQDEVKRSTFPLAPDPSTSLPPAPRLEQIDRLAKGAAANASEWERMRLEVLHSYGPSDQEGFIHVPINRAMDVIAEKKMLKARPEPAAERERSLGLVDAGEPNSGRLLRGGTK